MPMKTLSLTAAFFLAAATAASAQCSWSKQTVAQTPVDTKKMSQTQMAEAPVDLWLVEYLEAWEQA
ncbi:MULTISPECIES: hypothetical protein [unclassified Roseitalea]|uniref:hypothetical protein n=1 Tax=unclassified Roseitalea TaxID=2639107 RepID=UPI00273E4701|nr:MULTISPECIES: hypothetical protein [unclassified Roseitalea]